MLIQMLYLIAIFNAVLAPSSSMAVGKAVWLSEFSGQVGIEGILSSCAGLLIFFLVRV